MSDLVKTPTKCKLCGHLFSEELLHQAAVLGANPQAKLQQVDALTRPLMKHLQKKHPDVISHAQIAGATFAGYLTFLAFEIDAETISLMGSDYNRWKIHQLTMRPEARISDERIEQRLTEIFDKRVVTPSIPREALFDDLLVMMRQMRDVMEERGRYTEGPIVATPNHQGT